MASDVKDIKYLFPPDTKIIHFSGSPDKYSAILRSKCKSKEEFRQNWLKQYEKLSRVALRVLLTRPKTGKTVVYKAAFRCQHNTYPASHQRVKAPHRKHTGCPAVLKVTIKASPENRRVRSVDTLRREYPTIISINHDHNHRLPNQGILVNDCISSEKIKSDCSDSGCDTIRTPWSESELKEEDKLKEDELDWDFLKDCWNSFIEKWESTNSMHLYKALLKATTFLENCKTVNTTIAALNSIGKKFDKKKCDIKVLSEPESLIGPKAHYNGPCFNEEGIPVHVEVSNAVDELLVIDQGCYAMLLLFNRFFGGASCPLDLTAFLCFKYINNVFHY